MGRYGVVWTGVRKHWLAMFTGTVLMLALAGVSLVPPLVMRRVVDEAIVHQDLVLLTRLVLLLAGLYVASSCLSLVSSAVFAVASQRVLHETRRSVFRHVVNLPVESLEQAQSGYLTARMAEISALGALFSSGTFRLLVSFLEFAGALIILFHMNPSLTWVLLAFLPVHVLIVLLVSGRFRKTSTALLQSGGLMSGKLQETFQGMWEVKNLGAEEKKALEAIHLSDVVARAGARQGKVAAFGTEALGLVSSLITVALLYVGGRQIVGDLFTLGGYLAFSGYAGKLLSPFGYLSAFGLTVQPALAAFSRIGDFLSQTTERDRYEGKICVPSINSLEFRSVSFAYSSRPAQPAVSDVSLALERPVKAAIVGPNGAGKTTLLRLVLGYYTSYCGEILVNGYELRDLNVPVTRKRFGVVSQDPFLFSGTVRDNLALVEGVAENGLDLLEENLAIRTLVTRLPQGLNTQVGEAGGCLSGGQRQIVAILRAFLRRPDVVLFDEATAHLDEEAREIVLYAIRSLFAESICMIVTHDADLAEVADIRISLRAGQRMETAI